ncbi:alpha/beta hydrolase [Novosphingobium sp. YAF33]|uniref:alpha/beta hydrolase n=1 Tax=Novosphingobium sp. YAF33 TaxID=3233082 RepID=UPI003F9670CD
MDMRAFASISALAILTSALFGAGSVAARDGRISYELVEAGTGSGPAGLVDPNYVEQVALAAADEEQSLAQDAQQQAAFWQSAPAGIPRGIARYGPFRVIDGTHAALVDATDSRSPEQFAALLRDYPNISELEMIECPGTEDDLANLRLGRLIRARGLTTHVPTGGSVRSGAVELFLAGRLRYADPGSEFAVHAWLDDTGRTPRDYAANAPENRRYLDYYQQMGMDLREAQAFYAMTNAIPFESARWFGAEEMARWVKLDRTRSWTSTQLTLLQR